MLHDGPAANSPNAVDAEAAAFALIEHKEHATMKPKNTICLWFDKDAHEAARFYAAPALRSSASMSCRVSNSHPDSEISCAWR